MRGWKDGGRWSEREGEREGEGRGKGVSGRESRKEAENITCSSIRIYSGASLSQTPS